MYVTKYLSAIWHAILDNFRPITIWVLDLYIYYSLYPGTGTLILSLLLLSLYPIFSFIMSVAGDRLLSHLNCFCIFVLNRPDTTISTSYSTFCNRQTIFDIISVVNISPSFLLFIGTFSNLHHASLLLHLDNQHSGRNGSTPAVTFSSLASWYDSTCFLLPVFVCLSLAALFLHPPLRHCTAVYSALLHYTLLSIINNQSI